MRTFFRYTLAVFTVGLFTGALLAQPDRLRGPIDNTEIVVLGGYVPPRARPEFDRGPVARSFPMPAVTLYFKPSASQQTALQQLLANQQNPASPDYHKWLTPELFADRFGLSQVDVNEISVWLRSQGLQVHAWHAAAPGSNQRDGPANGGCFSHGYSPISGNGQRYYANSTSPSIPAALSDIVLGLRGLNNYRLKPRSRMRGQVLQTPPAGGTSYGSRRLR